MPPLSRRQTIQLLAVAPAASLLGCEQRAAKSGRPVATGKRAGEAILATEPLQSIWQTSDPFLFCAHHLDAYPAGNGQLGPSASLSGRRLGQDFEQLGGWNMYHGRVVPGFPRHPHRGFETVTVVQTGLLDHADSLGATARYGQGDVQWLTAGRGIQHAEMFPLVNQQGDNPLELFQIWLNLPAANKMVEPHFSMLWSPRIPKLELFDAAGLRTTLTVSAGHYRGTAAPAPPPASYAAHPDANIAIWTLALEGGASFAVPSAPSGVDRSLYFHRGEGLVVDGISIERNQRIRLRADREVTLTAAAAGAELLYLQGRPLGEPVARHGPFVMNTEAEIRQAYADYQATEFGGWPWQRDDHVHPASAGRFALRPDGGREEPS